MQLFWDVYIIVSLCNPTHRSPIYGCCDCAIWETHSLLQETLFVHSAQISVLLCWVGIQSNRQEITLVVNLISPPNNTKLLLLTGVALRARQDRPRFGRKTVAAVWQDRMLSGKSNHSHIRVFLLPFVKERHWNSKLFACCAFYAQHTRMDVTGWDGSNLLRLS